MDSLQPGTALSDSQVADKNWRAYQRAYTAGHDEYVKLARKCEDYYIGEQWEPADKKKLEAQGRPALTINHILANVNTVLGEHGAQRLDLVYTPARNAAAETVGVLTKVAQQILRANHHPHLENTLVADGLIQDRGWLDVRMDFNTNVLGDVRVTLDDPAEVLPDPDGKEYDPASWNEVTTIRWMSVDDVALLYGEDKAKEVQALAFGGHTYGPGSIRFEDERTFGDWGEYAYTAPCEDGRERTIRAVLVIERQHRVLAPTRFFIDNQTGDLSAIPHGLSNERIAEIAKSANVSVIKRFSKQIRWTVSADRVVLHDDWSPYKSFTKIPFFPYFRRGRPFGMVRNLLSPQDQLNKTESQELHTVNSSANGGWTVEAGSLVNMSEDELESRGAETGLVLVHKKGTNAPQKIEPGRIPSGLDRVGQKSALHLSEIAGTSALLGAPSPEVSGVALGAGQQRDLGRMQVPFNHLNLTRSLLARKLLELIQEFYTETRVMRIVDPKQPGKTQEVTLNGMSPEGALFNDVTLGEYDVEVQSIPHVDPAQAEMAQVMSRVQMQSALLSVQEMQAKVQNLMAQSALTKAKAETAAGKPQADAAAEGARTRIALEKLKVELHEHAADLQNKLDLADIHTKAKIDTATYTAASKRLSDELKTMQPREQAGENTNTANR